MKTVNNKQGNNHRILFTFSIFELIDFVIATCKSTTGHFNIRVCTHTGHCWGMWQLHTWVTLVRMNQVATTNCAFLANVFHFRQNMEQGQIVGWPLTNMSQLKQGKLNQCLGQVGFMDEAVTVCWQNCHCLFVVPCMSPHHSNFLSQGSQVSQLYGSVFTTCRTEGVSEWQGYLLCCLGTAK